MVIYEAKMQCMHGFPHDNFDSLVIPSRCAHLHMQVSGFALPSASASGSIQWTLAAAAET